MINEEEGFKYLGNPNFWTIEALFINKKRMCLADKKRIINIGILAWNSLIVLLVINIFYLLDSILKGGDNRREREIEKKGE